MSFYFHRTPKITDLFFPKLLWRKPDGNKIYLTFDDGPDPISTPIILDILSKKEIKAVFFCIGENMEKYPELLQSITHEGHHIGNHSYSHTSGWRPDTGGYIKSVHRCQEIINDQIGSSARCFRPPYGRLKPGQMNRLIKDYQIVMWSLMSGDFDPNQSAEKCFQVVKQKTRPGDIVLFHDKASIIHKLEKVLPQYLDYCHSKGLGFSLL